MPVRVACDKLSARVEANPDRFMRIDCIHHWNEARTRVAKLIGAETDECVLVNNTSHGITTVLRNFEWNEGDIIIGGRSRITALKFSHSCYPFSLTQQLARLTVLCPERLGILEILHHTHKCPHFISSSLPHMRRYWRIGENMSAE